MESIHNKSDNEVQAVKDKRLFVDNIYSDVEISTPESAITNSQYTAINPPVEYPKRKKPKDINEQEKVTKYKRHAFVDKEKLFFYIYEKGMTVRGAAKELNIASSTAQNWVSSEAKKPKDIVEKKINKEKSLILEDKHKDFLLELIDEKPSLVISEIIDEMTTAFPTFDISKSVLHKHMNNNWKISFTKVDRNIDEQDPLENIKERHELTQKLLNSNIDYTRNCVFVDESVFHINMKRNYAWSRKGEKNSTTNSKPTRAKATTIFGAISPKGVIDITIRRPKAMSTLNIQNDFITDPYFRFVDNTVNLLDQNEQFKGHYIVMNNAPILLRENMQEYLEKRGYRSIYLPLCARRLNPVDQFWNICKNRLKRTELLEEETLSTRLDAVKNNILLGELENIFLYSSAMIHDFINRLSM